MANHATLFTSSNDSLSCESDELILMANYAVPLCWLAMCSPEHLQHAQDEEGQEIPMLVIPLAEARRNFATRHPAAECRRWRAPRPAARQPGAERSANPTTPTARSSALAHANVQSCTASFGRNVPGCHAVVSS